MPVPEAPSLTFCSDTASSLRRDGAVEVLFPLSAVRLPGTHLAGDLLAAINAANLRAHWSNTVGLGFRIQTPLGGALAVDYGFLLNPPEFLIPQRGPDGIKFDGTPAIFRLGRTQLHFRITQTF